MQKPPPATTPATAPSSAEVLSFAAAVRFWLKLGCISFGGPAGQIAIMHQELVVRRRWISERRFLHALNYCMLLPGPEAQQLATYIGWLLHGVKGGLAAGALFVLPSLLILVALSWIYMELGDVPAVAGMLDGVKPAVVAIVLFAAWRVGSRTLTSVPLWGLAAAAFVAILIFKVPFPYVVLGAGLAGFLGSKVAPARFQPAARDVARSVYDSALIDDHTVSPEHARASGRRLAFYVAAALVLWAGVEGLLWSAFGWSGAYPQMGWFFTKAALLTFGGAYAVLPYVQQAAVDQFGWLTPAQMIDGLALGETTPGPLIMIVAFVGFVGGWTLAPFGTSEVVLAGIVGATIATWFTFLPSFLFIFIGAPLVEATRGDLKLTAPLTAITAAIVGVILNLAVYFAGHVFWPHGFDVSSGIGALLRELDWFAALLVAAAFVAQWRYKLGVIPIILACAAIGLARTMLP